MRDDLRETITTTETKTTKVPVLRMIATMRKLKGSLSDAAETLRDEREPSRERGGENCSVFLSGSYYRYI